MSVWGLGKHRIERFIVGHASGREGEEGGGRAGWPEEGRGQRPRAVQPKEGLADPAIGGSSSQDQPSGKPCLPGLGLPSRLGTPGPWLAA